MGSTFIILTTIHAQDFRDEAGDRVQGRQTLPIVFPVYSRLSMIVSLVVWPLLLYRLYGLSLTTIFGQALMGFVVGCRFVWLREPEEDDYSYLLYNVVCSFHSFSLGLTC